MTERTKALVCVIGLDLKTLLDKMLLLEGSQRTPVEEQWKSFIDQVSAVNKIAGWLRMRSSASRV